MVSEEVIQSWSRCVQNHRNPVEQIAFNPVTQSRIHSALTRAQVLLQAAAAGVPVITSRAGGLPEAVQDGVTGILCPPGDVDALAAAIDRLAGDPALRHQYGEAGRQRILAEFSIGRMVDGNLALYHQVLGR